MCVRNSVDSLCFVTVTVIVCVTVGNDVQDNVAILLLKRGAHGFTGPTHAHMQDDFNPPPKPRGDPALVRRSGETGAHSDNACATNF